MHVNFIVYNDWARFFVLHITFFLLIFCYAPFARLLSHICERWAPATHWIIILKAVFLCCQFICKPNWNGKKETSLGWWWMRQPNIMAFKPTLNLGLCELNNIHTHTHTQFVYECLSTLCRCGWPNNCNIFVQWCDFPICEYHNFDII